MDIGSWGVWSTLEVLDSETATWEQPGDEIRYERRTPLPGLPMRGKAALDEVIPDELVRMTMTTTGLSDLPIECRFDHAGSAAFTLSLEVDTEDPAGFFEDALERILFMEILIERDMRSCLEGLEKVLTKATVS